MVMPREWGDEEEPAEEEKPLPYYPHEGAWVHDHVLPTFGREWSPRTRWCKDWYLHPEAKTILRTLWLSWEETRLHPGKMANWYSLTFYPLWDRLLSDEGPFIGCTYGFGTEPARHDEPVSGHPLVRELPRNPLPADLFDAVPSQSTGDE